MNDRAAVNAIYNEFRYKIPDPYGFAIMNADHHDDAEYLKRRARSWRRRHLNECLAEIEAERADLTEREDRLKARLAELDEEEKEGPE